MHQRPSRCLLPTACPLVAWTTGSWTNWWAHWAVTRPRGAVRWCCRSGCRRAGTCWTTGSAPRYGTPYTAAVAQGNILLQQTNSPTVWAAAFPMLCVRSLTGANKQHALCLLALSFRFSDDLCPVVLPSVSTYLTVCPTPLPCWQLIRVCSEHGQAVTALSVYEWMKAPAVVGGAGLGPTVYTYTAAMRAALAAGLLDRALQVWEDAQAAQCQLDCRLCITFIEVSLVCVCVEWQVFMQPHAWDSGFRLEC